MARLRRRHAMPFGAVPLADGGVRFRLWAPAAKSVYVILWDVPVRRAMDRDTEGWFECISTEACIGSRYTFRIDGRSDVPDPASRFQPADVHGPSEVIDPEAWVWTDGDWRGRPWNETVLYELHVGAFTGRGDFEGVEERLDYLAHIGITAIELMPVADFPGARNWGYDGVLPFAPDHRYGRPESLKSLVQAAHRRGIMMFLDVVYNHFGPEGNYLHVYAPQFFDDAQRTPWGGAIAFDNAHAQTVREYFIHNALYWLEEFHFDGLRLDAVHQIRDPSEPHVLVELARRVRDGPGRSRRIHLVLENDDNTARLLERDDDGRSAKYTAQWNDDVHHALHVLLTGEADRYYEDYEDLPVRRLARGLAEGYVYQGEASRHRDGRPRGEPSCHLPPCAFVNFLQNHDHVGNRPFGERISALAGLPAVRAATAIVVLAPSVPLLFMGEEFLAEQPFPFFCDFSAELANAVCAGRREELKGACGSASDAACIPDPNAESTFAAAILDWSALERPAHAHHADFVRRLLRIRRQELAPRLSRSDGQAGRWQVFGEAVLSVAWPLSDGARLHLIANLSANWATIDEMPAGRCLFAEPDGARSRERPEQRHATTHQPPWSVRWLLDEGATHGHRDTRV